MTTPTGDDTVRMPAERTCKWCATKVPKNTTVGWYNASDGRFCCIDCYWDHGRAELEAKNKPTPWPLLVLALITCAGLVLCALILMGKLP